MKHYARLACFVGGTVFGSAGIRLLTSKEAKKVYTRVVALGLRVKDYVMENVTAVQENAADILAAAQDLNDAADAQEAAAQIDDLDEAIPAE
ncbi:MAG: DUF6110 family protein [Eubacteriales bacterium]|nr:DUF6110 family protein [Eubacteriales bacterium]